MPEEHIVVAGLLRRRGRALMVHRSPQRRWYPDAWDLPGGHVEVGEVPRLALARELREELGIAAEVARDPFATIQGVDFRIDIWTIDQWTGEPSSCAPEEHDALAWLTDKELHGLRLADPRLQKVLHAGICFGREDLRTSGDVRHHHWSRGPPQILNNVLAGNS
jgi:8-oxo-dGTP diphosphatase